MTTKFGFFRKMLVTEPLFWRVQSQGTRDCRKRKMNEASKEIK